VSSRLCVRAAAASDAHRLSDFCNRNVLKAAINVEEVVVPAAEMTSRIDRVLLQSNLTGLVEEQASWRPWAAP